MIHSTVFDIERQVFSLVEEKFGAFVREQVNPGSAERNARGVHYSRELLRGAGEVGLLSLGTPQAFGGQGATHLTYGLALEQLGYLCDDSAFVMLLALRTSLLNTLCESGRDDLIETYAARTLRGEIFPAFSYTEGQDAYSFRTSVRHVPELGWILNGTKAPVMGGMSADYIMVYASTADGDLMTFIVEKSDPGVCLTPVEVTGLRSNGNCSLELKSVRLDESRVLVKSDGLSHAQRTLNDRRLLLACVPLGRMRRLLEKTITKVNESIRYERPVSEMQHVQATLGKMYVAIESCRALTYRALVNFENHGDRIWDPLSSAAKYNIGELANQFVLDAYHVLGTTLYVDDSFAQFQRDFATLVAVSGTQASIMVNLGMLAASEVAMANERRAT